MLLQAPEIPYKDISINTEVKNESQNYLLDRMKHINNPVNNPSRYAGI